jgi:hypothetical protein
MSVEKLIDDLLNHAATGVEGSIAAAKAAALFEPLPPPVYPEESSSEKERRWEDREALRRLASIAVSGRVTDGLVAEAVLVLNRLLSSAGPDGDVDIEAPAKRAAKACLMMAALLGYDAPELVMRQQKQLTLRLLEVL